MKRRCWLFGALAGQAGGQTVIPPGGSATRTLVGCIGPDGHSCEPKIPKPENGRCPVCLVKAPPYIRDVSGMKGCAPPTCGPDGACLAICRPWTIDDLAKTRDIACTHCSVVFRQTAGDVKP